MRASNLETTIRHETVTNTAEGQDHVAHLISRLGLLVQDVAQVSAPSQQLLVCTLIHDGCALCPWKVTHDHDSIGLDGGINGRIFL